MGADYYTKDRSIPEDNIGIEDGVVIDGTLVDKNVMIGAGARIVASEAPRGDGHYGDIVVNDGIAVVRKAARIPAGWSFANCGQ